MSIAAKNLFKSYNDGSTRALVDLSVTIGQGEFVAVIGLSGAGKSTFLRTLNGMVPIDSGSLQVLGLDVPKLQENELVRLRQPVAFIFQQFNLLKNLTVEQNILIGRAAHMPLWRMLSGFFSATDRALAKKILATVGLEDREQEKARNLSGGEQQRVAIARALIQEPKIILADEPMASLDPRLADLVIQMLQKFNRDKGITVVINIHDLNLAKKYAQRIVGLRQGSVVFDGSPADLSEAVVDSIFGHGMEAQ